MACETNPRATKSARRKRLRFGRYIVASPKKLGRYGEPWNTPLLSVRDVFVLTCGFIQLLAYRAIVDPGGGLSRSTRGALPIAAAAMLR